MDAPGQSYKPGWTEGNTPTFVTVHTLDLGSGSTHNKEEALDALLVALEERIGLRRLESSGRGYGTFLSAEQRQHDGSTAIFATVLVEMLPGHALDGCVETMNEAIYLPASQWSSSQKEIFIVMTSRCRSKPGLAETMRSILMSFKEEDR